MNKKGFTLVEVLVVLAILAILLLLVVPNMFTIMDKNKEKSCNSLRTNIESAAKLYVTNNKYDLEFTCGSTKEITLQTLVDSGDLKLEDNTLTNPLTEEEIPLTNTVSVTYDCNTKEFIYTVNGINCTTGENSCINTATVPTVSNKIYNGSEQTGVTGGTNINIVGDSKGTNVGNYTVTVMPTENYCWNDYTKSAKEYTWKIVENKPTITLADKTVVYNGNKVSIDNATVKNSSGTTITGIPVIYTYYSGNSCSGTATSDQPTNAGEYSAKAYTSDHGSYNASESNCAKLTISRANPTLTTSSSSLTSNYPDDSSFTYTYNGDGTLSCSSSNTSIATCSLNTNNRTVTIDTVKPGSATIRISASQGTNYNSTYKDVSVSIGGSVNTLSVSPIEGLIYNKEAQTLATVSNEQGDVYWSTTTELTSSNYTSGSTTISTGTNAGSYTVYYYTPGNAYYKPISGSVTTSIGKATCACTISSVSSMKYPTSTSGTLKYSCGGDGTISTSSSDTSIITTGTAGKTQTTLTAKKNGSATLTVKQSSGSNYNACTNDSKTATVSLSKYTISYDANGGEGAPSSQTKTHGTDLTLSSKKPTRTNYNFLGWSTSDTATSATYDAGDTFTTNATTTLYAVWERITYTVSYDANGGSDAPSSQTKYSGSNLTLTTSTPTRSGYTFSSWNTYANGTGTSYDPGDTYSTEASVTLYAQWTANGTSYTITYYANGGTGGPGSETKTSSCMWLSSVKPTRSGYTFLNWNEAQNGTGTTWESGAYYCGDRNLTLYAQWSGGGGSSTTTPTTHTCTVTAIGNTLRSISSTKLSCGHTHTSAFYRYCSVCGKSAALIYGEGMYACPCGPQYTVIFNDSGVSKSAYKTWQGTTVSSSYQLNTTTSISRVCTEH